MSMESAQQGTPEEEKEEPVLMTEEELQRALGRFDSVTKNSKPPIDTVKDVVRDDSRHIEVANDTAPNVVRDMADKVGVEPTDVETSADHFAHLVDPATVLITQHELSLEDFTTHAATLDKSNFGDLDASALGKLYDAVKGADSASDEDLERAA